MNETQDGAQQRRRKDDTMEVSGPAGFRLRVTGKESTVILFMATVGVCIWYTVFAHGQSTEEATRRIEERQMSTNKTLEEMVYILSLSEEERRRLEISMPDSLREKQRNNDTMRRAYR